MENNKNLHIVNGSKGGVGKSFVCMALLDYLTQHDDKKITLIESDTSNPDVAKAYAKDNMVEVISLRLDDADGWIELVNICDNTGNDIVVNSAARSNDAVAEYGVTLTESLEELQRNAISYWVINRQRDSIELLKKYEQHMNGTIHVVRNTYYGDAKKFELYNSSVTAKHLESRGKTLNFPDLADRVADDLYSKRLSIVRAIDELPIGNRAELKRWRKLAWEMFGGALQHE